MSFGGRSGELGDGPDCNGELWGGNPLRMTISELNENRLDATRDRGIVQLVETPPDCP